MAIMYITTLHFSNARKHMLIQISLYGVSLETPKVPKSKIYIKLYVDNQLKLKSKELKCDKPYATWNDKVKLQVFEDSVITLRLKSTRCKTQNKTIGEASYTINNKNYLNSIFKNKYEYIRRQKIHLSRIGEKNIIVSKWVGELVIGELSLEEEVTNDMKNFRDCLTQEIEKSQVTSN
ncbi:hypothetical protein QYM36_004352 [Artemia franciscana]|uniref:C2 domain-containing protein n=1 Tax=Artemia franciscana TaxID=6661 RepID=A0AA88I9K5_ARTSF|nr:hypothetical protein QYM36_004352 [Artemia franciscana]